MPVTFSPAPHNKIEPWKHSKAPGFRDRPGASSMCTSASLLADVAWLQNSGSNIRIREHLQSTFGRKGDQPISVVASRNGLVDTVIEAYSNHQALVIRPDDVWTTILTQFSLFVNGEGRTEQLRHMFVAHEGKKKLIVEMEGTRDTVDFGAAARIFTEKIHEHVVDPELREWCLPSFSTTTANDTIVASVVMMATLKSYFEYEMMLGCGIPRVTLLGTPDDWINIFDRVDRLGRYGPETAAWRDLLKPVLARFVRAFEPGYADSKKNRDFWQHVASRQWAGSFSGWLTGWITAFCAFNDQGRWMGDMAILERYRDSPESVHSTPYVHGELVGTESHDVWTAPSLMIDNVRYLSIDPKRVPIAHAEVEIRVIDNGVELSALMTAGLVGTSVDAARADGGDIVRDGEVRPVSAWWIHVPGNKTAHSPPSPDPLPPPPPDPLPETLTRRPKRKWWDCGRLFFR